MIYTDYTFDTSFGNDERNSRSQLPFGTVLTETLSKFTPRASEATCSPI